ncbi:MAG: hypothetical protein HYV60_03680 [Planctomycetia bacterium]|nr:hypothetical protein [Planctomycetia bacterium]
MSRLVLTAGIGRQRDQLRLDLRRVKDAIHTQVAQWRGRVTGRGHAGVVIAAADRVIHPDFNQVRACRGVADTADTDQILAGGRHGPREQIGTARRSICERWCRGNGRAVAIEQIDD